MANKDKTEQPTSLPNSQAFAPDDVAKDAGGTPRVEKDAKGVKTTHESDQLQRDMDRARALQVGQGGPFSKARIDPTETDEALAARGYGPKAKSVDLRGAEKGYRLVRTRAPGTYRQGIRVPGGVVVAVPKDEPHAKWMVEDVDQERELATIVLPPLPEPSEDDKKLAQKQREEQRLADIRAAEMRALAREQPNR